MKIKWIGIFWCWLAYGLSSLDASATFKTALEGQSKGDTNWISVNLQNWKELDYIPLRVKMTGGPVSNQVITVSFDHSKNLIPGVQNLISFVPSSNVVIKSAPMLIAPPGAETWTYNFTVDVTNAGTATVQFVGRLSAGAHLFVGSSLALSSPTLQIHKPAAAPGNPDLMVQKSGPSHAAIGETITYTVLYTNLSSPYNTAATGIQLSDVLPDCVTYVPGSATDGGTLAGNVLTWDLNGLAVGASGTVSYQVVVATNAVTGQTFTNWARIFSAENDADFSNNESSVATEVEVAVSGNADPTAMNDSYSTDEDVVLNVVAPGLLGNDSDADLDPLTAVLLTSPVHGTLTLGTNGSFVYTPQPNYNGGDSFTYQANDGITNSLPATVSIIVLPVNDAPMALDNIYDTREDIPLNIVAPGVLNNDSDVDGDPLSALVETLPLHGTLSLETNGSFVYTPLTNFHGNDSFTYRANDGVTSSSVATATITVAPVNDDPIAPGDDYIVNEDTILIVSAPGVLANDSDVDGDFLRAILRTNPSHGILAFNTNGSFMYTPAANYTGPDSFSYHASDGVTNSLDATVNITVVPVNDPPLATDDSYVTAEDTVLNVLPPGVLTNDPDIDGDNLVAILVSLPSHGTVSLNTNGAFVYAPASNYNGVDTFTYVANDGFTNSALATVMINVTPVNDPPVAVNDSYSIGEDTALNVPASGVLNNDSDIDGDPLRAFLMTGPLHGVLSLNTNGSFNYVPASNYNGSDSFTYRAFDGSANSSVATVNITIGGLNDPPVAVNDNYSTVEDTTLNVVASGILTNDADIDGNSLTAILVSSVTHGTVSLSANGGFSYTPTANYNGPDSFTYVANDGITNSAIATVTINVISVNDPPVGVNDSYNTLEDLPLNVSASGVLTNDADIDGDSLAAILIAPPSHGSVVLSTNGAFVYAPVSNYNGSDAFTYVANDGVTNSGVTIVTITVIPINDPPIAVNDNYSTAEDTVLNVSASGVLSNDSDMDGDPLRALLMTGPIHGTLSLNTNGSFSYVPASNYNGSDSFTYHAFDGTSNSSVATVNITIGGVNDPPVAVDDFYNIAEDTTLNVVAAGILTNDTDIDANSLTAILVSSSSHGTVSLSTNGAFMYTPAANYNGPDAFTYVANDGFTNSALATVTVNVIPVNDPPVAVNDSYSTGEDTTLNVPGSGVLSNDSDIDGDRLKAFLAAAPLHGTLSLNTNGSFSYVPASNYNGSDGFTYRAFDGTANSSIATVNITIGGVNDPPVADNDSYNTVEDTTLNVAAAGILTNDTDIDGNSLTAILVSSASHGTLSLSANGSFVYTPAANYNGPDAFTYRANDGFTNSAIATVTINVTPVNDPPVAMNDSYSTDEDVNLNISAPGVLGNDTDTEGDLLKAAVVTLPEHGTLTLNTNGSFNYTPAVNYNGPDSFSYRATDGLSNSFPATVSITVVPRNDAPVAAADSFSTSEDVTLTVPLPGVLSNDTDVDGDVLKATIGSLPSHGTVILNTNGSFVYVPATNYYGTDSFTYRANDGVTNSPLATVTITVTSVNDPPVANNDSYSTPEDVALTVLAPGVLLNDGDVDGNILRATLVSSPSHGTVSLSTNGSFVYTPVLNFNGNDSFTYRATDNVTSSAPATVTITVTPRNDAPTFNGDGGYVVNEDSGPESVPGYATNISAGAPDESSQLLTFILTNNNNAIFSSQPTLTPAGTLNFTPAPNAFGTSIVTAILQDNGGTANGGANTSVPHTFVLIVNPVNDPPSFNKGPDQSVNQGAPAQTMAGWATGLSVGPANESEQTASFLLVNDNPALFAVAPQISNNGSLTYTPASGMSGVAHLSVVLQDNGGTANGGMDTSPAQDFLITINGPPVATIISPTNGSVFIAGTTIPILCDATDADGTVTNLALFRNGAVISNLTQPYLCTWANPSAGNYHFTATATDNLGLTGEALPVDIAVIEQPPLTILVQIHFNPQTGLFEQTVRIGNPTSSPFPGIRIFTSNLTNGASLYNASGTSNGVQYAQYNSPIPAGQSGNMVLEYYVPSRITPSPVLFAQVVAPSEEFRPTGAAMQITRAMMLTNGTMLLDFKTQTNRCYYIQYSSDLIEWRTAGPCIIGTGSHMQWLDNGPPKTDALPCNKSCCVYRLLQLP